MAVQFRWQNPTVSSLVAYGSGLTGTTQVTIEINRAEDFSSDDSIFMVVAKASGAADVAVNVTGLPSGTPWYGRIRSDNSGERSASDLMSTLPVAVTTTYAGYSIAKAMLVVPVGIKDIRQATAGGPAEYIGRPGFPATNLLRNDPSSTFQCTSGLYGTGLQMQIRFTTSGEPIDVVSLLGLNVNDADYWQIQSANTEDGFGAAGSALYTAQTLRVSPTIGQRQSYHALYRLPAPSTHRFWVLQLFLTTPHFIARNLVVGKARESTNADKGAGYGVNDLGSATRTRFGVLDSVRGWRGKIVDFAMSWLSETEFQAKWADLPGLVGTTKAVLAIPNSKRNIHLNDRIAFGNITQMRGENVQSFKYSQTIEINSIY